MSQPPSVPEPGTFSLILVSIVGFSQGVPFYHAGIDLLRSKSFDRDSFNSGDWFNRLDFTYQTNNWGVGLPVASKNQSNWPLFAPLLADPALWPSRPTSAPRLRTSARCWPSAGARGSSACRARPRSSRGSSS